MQRRAVVVLPLAGDRTRVVAERWVWVASGQRIVQHVPRRNPLLPAGECLCGGELDLSLDSVTY